ncbi:MAG: alanine racemase [Comamonas sp.]|jgi:alanine racemase|uniref:alanine racemase n=1 Tax=Comamonas sp. TaxID=34028 RepID=UPI00281AC286|nr:alanine racemase [Comamonas sp.]MDR0216034.1 alanine racemase [Comamonas sp.]
MSLQLAAHDGPRLCIDLGALKHNWQAVSSICPGSRVGAVVKNDAYGLGVPNVVPPLWQWGCRNFWVATVDEALAVRACLPVDASAAGLRILVLNGLAGLAAEDFTAHGLTPVLAGPHELAALAGYAARHGQRMPVALHLDTGLTRLGFGAAELAQLQSGSRLWDDAQVQLWVTHLGRFHDPEAPQCQRQHERFVQWTAQLPRAERSIATSSSVFAGPGWHFEQVRVGSALFGVPIGTQAAELLQPVASLRAPVLRVADVSEGTEVGYAGSYVTGGSRRIATVAMGYGHGLPFGLVNRGHLILAGRPAPIVGGVAMGMVGLDVSGYAPGEIQPGMWAEVYGRQQPLQTLAAAAGVAANVVLALSARLAPHRRQCGAAEAMEAA